MTNVCKNNNFYKNDIIHKMNYINYKYVNNKYKKSKYIYNNNNILVFCIYNVNDKNINYEDIIKKICRTNVDIIYYKINNVSSNLIYYYKTKIKNIINKQKYNKIILLGIDETIKLIMKLNKYTFDDCIYIIKYERINYTIGSNNKILNKKILNMKISIGVIKRILYNFIKYYNNRKIYKSNSVYKVLTNNPKYNLIILFTDSSNTKIIDIDMTKDTTDIILFSDIYNSYYTKGLYGISNSIDTSIEYISNIIKKYKTVVFIGYHFGGYAALLYGSILNIKSVIVVRPVMVINTSYLNLDSKYNNVINFFNTNTEYYIYITTIDSTITNIISKYNNIQIHNIDITDVNKLFNSDLIVSIYKTIFYYNRLI